MSEQMKKCKHCQTDIPKKSKVCPNCRKKQGNKLGIALIVVGVLIVIGVLGGGDDTSSTSTNTTSEVASAPVEITYTQATVSDMMSMLDSNALKAEKTYQDQYVEITGRLSNIDSDGSYITLVPTDDEWAILGVQCYIKSDEQLNRVLEMTVGDTVTLKGKVTTVGEVLGYGLDIDEIKYVKH